MPRVSKAKPRKPPKPRQTKMDLGDEQVGCTYCGSGQPIVTSTTVWKSNIRICRGCLKRWFPDKSDTELDTWVKEQEQKFRQVQEIQAQRIEEERLKRERAKANV